MIWTTSVCKLNYAHCILISLPFLMVHKHILRVNNIIFTSYSFSIILVQSHTILHNIRNSSAEHPHKPPALALSLQCIIFMLLIPSLPPNREKNYFSSHLSISTMVATIGIARYATFMQSYKTR